MCVYILVLYGVLSFDVTSILLVSYIAINTTYFIREEPANDNKFQSSHSF